MCTLSDAYEPFADDKPFADAEPFTDAEETEENGEAETEAAKAAGEAETEETEEAGEAAGGTEAAREAETEETEADGGTEADGWYEEPWFDRFQRVEEMVQRSGLSYQKGQRHDYLLKCCYYMYRYQFDRSEIENWALRFDLGGDEIRKILSWIFRQPLLPKDTWVLRPPRPVRAKQKAGQKKNASWNDLREGSGGNGSSGGGNGGNGNGGSGPSHGGNGSGGNGGSGGSGSDGNGSSDDGNGNSSDSGGNEGDSGGGNGSGNSKPSATPQEIWEYVRERVSLRYNVISQQNEVQWLNEEDARNTNTRGGDHQRWRPFTDRDESTLLNRMRQDGMKLTVERYQSVLKGDLIALYNPFVSYLEHLPEWQEGDPDYVAELAARVQLTDRNPELAQWFTHLLKKWMVALIAGILEPKSVNQTVLTLIGRQGNYKSTFFKYLLPPELEDYYLVKIHNEMPNKDDTIALAQYILINLEEVDYMSRKEVNLYKAWISMVDINERKAYAHNREHMNHIASFCATGNNTQFLTDLTGTRRWLPFEVDAIVSPKEHPLNYTGIYAQVWALYRHGFRYWFTQEENEALNRYNERFSAPILERDLLLQYFSVPQPTQTSQWMSLGEIIERINLHVKQALVPARLGQIMRQEHFVCKRVKRGMIYLVHAKSEDENRLTDEREGTVLNGGEPLLPNAGEEAPSDTPEGELPLTTDEGPGEEPDEEPDEAPPA